jgi:hypothetical protein
LNAEVLRSNLSLFSDLNQNWNVLTNFSTTPNIKSRKNLFNRSRVNTRVRTDRHRNCNRRSAMLRTCLNVDVNVDAIGVSIYEPDTSPLERASLNNS